MSKNPCPLPKPLNTRNVKKDLTASDVAESIKKYYAKLKQLSGGLNTTAQLNSMELGESLQNSLAGLVDGTVSRGTKFQYFESWMSQALNWRKGLIGDAFSTSGAVQERLLRMTEAVNNSLGAYVATQTTEVYKAMETLKGFGIENIKDVQVILHDSAIVSSGNQIIGANAGNEMVARFIENRKITFETMLTERYGLSEQQVTQVLELGENYQKVYQDAFMYLREAGLPIREMQGYVPVTFDTDFTKQIESKFNNLDSLMEGLGNVNPNSLATKARSEFVDYIVSDVATATHMFSGLKETLGREIYPVDVLRWGSDSNAFKSEVLSKLSNSAVNQLMESGAITKLPSMYADLVQQYVFREGVAPGIAQDVLISDPVRALTEYTLNLKTQLKESSVVQDLLSNGVDKGWLVGAEQLSQLSAKEIADNFIKIGDDARFQGLIANYVNAPSVATATNSLYVHKSVATAISALVDFNTSPDLLGSLGQVTQIMGKFNGYLSKSMLANSVSAIAQVTQNTIQMYSAVGGAGVMKMPQALLEVSNVMIDGFKAIDDTRAVIDLGGEQLTKRQLLERLINTRGSNPFNQVGSGARSLNVGDLGLKLRNTDYAALVRKFQWNAHHMPLTDKVLKILGLPGDVVNAAFQPVALANFLGDMSARYATILTIAENGYKVNDMYGFGGKSFKNVEELFQHADEYFGLFDGSSNVSSTVGRYVMPFFSYAMNYPGQVIRHAWREPRRFHNVYRFYNAYKNQADRDKGSYYDDVSWQRERLLIEVATDPLTGRKVSINPSGVSSDLSFLEAMDNNVSSLTRLFGLGSTKDRVADLEAKVNPAKTFGDTMAKFVEGTYLSNAYEVLTNKNPWSGEQNAIEEQYRTATVAGVPVNPLTRRILLFAAPALNTLDRSLPEDISGRRATKNAAGVDTVPGVPGWLGVVPEQGGVTGNPDMNLMFGSVGVRTANTDTVKNLVTNYNELNTIITDSGRVMKSLTAAGKVNSDEFRQAQEVALIADLYKREIDARATELGVPAPTVFNEARQIRMKPVNQLLRPMMPKRR